MTRAVAVIGADRRDDRFLVLAHESLQVAQVGLALGERGHGMREVRFALQGKRGLEFGVSGAELLKRFGSHRGGPRQRCGVYESITRVALAIVPGIGAAATMPRCCARGVTEP